MHHSQLVYVKKAPGKGRGVFATQDIAKGTLIEKVPVVVVPVKDFVDGWDNPTLNKYLYIWSKTSVGIALGYGSIYNHSFEPNADFEFGRESLGYRAIRDIAKDEEITVNYNGDPSDQTEVWFKVV